MKNESRFHTYPALTEFLILITISWIVLPLNAAGRSGDVYSNIEDRQEAICPDNAFVIVGFGQSNSANYTSNPFPRNTDVPAYNFWNGKCYLIEDPVLGATGNMGSIWTLLSHKFYEKFNKPIIIITAGVGTTIVKNWLDIKYRHLSRMQVQINIFKTNLNKEPNLYIWHQGETDAKIGTDKELYRNQLNIVFDTLLHNHSITKPHFFLFLASVSNDTREGNTGIRDGQRQVSQERLDTTLVLDTDQLKFGFRQKDKTHFNYNGVNKITDAIIEKIASQRKQWGL